MTNSTFGLHFRNLWETPVARWLYLLSPKSNTVFTLSVLNIAYTCKLLMALQHLRR